MNLERLVGVIHRAVADNFAEDTRKARDIWQGNLHMEQFTAWLEMLLVTPCEVEGRQRFSAAGGRAMRVRD